VIIENRSLISFTGGGTLPNFFTSAMMFSLMSASFFEAVADEIRVAFSSLYEYAQKENRNGFTYTKDDTQMNLREMLSWNYPMLALT